MVQIYYYRKEINMEFVRIEVITANEKKFSSEIETEGLYTINCALGAKIELLDKICDICISDEIILLRTEDRDFRNGCLSAPFVKDNREENNINAFDWQGNHLWNIGELVGDIKMAFDGITHITSDEANREFGIIAEPTSNLYKCISGGFIFIIDVNSRKLLLKEPGRAK